MALLMAGPGAAAAPASPSTAEDALASAQALLNEVQAGPATQKLIALLREAGIEAQPPLAPSGAFPISLPGLAALVDAAQVAEALRERAFERLDADAVLAVLSSPMVASPAASDPVPPTMKGLVASPSSGAIQPDTRLVAMRGLVGLDSLATAQLALLQALEQAVPALEGPGLGPEAVPQAPSACGAGGDVVFETSDCRVIVGNTGPNTYGPGVDPVVLVDLGGNDVYTNGAANAVSSVRVLVDLSGDDAYTVSAASGVAGGAATAQGIATASLGVALLADLGGNDTYSATATTTAPQPGPVAGLATVTSQGVARLGAAVLLDAGGHDTFTATATSSGGGATALAHGAATLGIGVLLNLGALEEGTDDSYSAQTGSTLHKTVQTPQFAQFAIGPADVTAQGAAQLGGVGGFVEAGGNDLVLAGSFGGVAALVGQGAAVGGAGLVVDVGGNDVYGATAKGDVTLSLITTDLGVCWEVSVTVTAGETRALAQGAAIVGAGVFADGTGNDVRNLFASGFAAAVAEAFSGLDCSVFGGNKASATATSGPGTAIGQGSGNLGVGVLVDIAGTDANTLFGESKARARAIAFSPGPDVETATATAGAGQTLGQGHSATGVGVAADVLGTDTYSSIANSVATTEKTSGVVSVLGPRLQSVQGFGGGGAGWLLELDGTDTYSTSPAGASAATNNACWSNGSSGGRGRDLQIGALPPPGCP